MANEARHSSLLSLLADFRTSGNAVMHALAGYQYGSHREALSESLLSIDATLEELVVEWTGDSPLNMDERIIREVFGFPIISSQEYATTGAVQQAFFDVSANRYYIRWEAELFAEPFHPSQVLGDAWKVAEYVNTFCHYYEGKLRLNRREDTVAANWSKDRDTGDYVAEWGVESDSTSCYRGFGESPALAICHAALRWCEFGKSEIR